MGRSWRRRGACPRAGRFKSRGSGQLLQPLLHPPLLHSLAHSPVPAGPLAPRSVTGHAPCGHPTCPGTFCSRPFRNPTQITSCPKTSNWLYWAPVAWARAVSTAGSGSFGSGAGFTPQSARCEDAGSVRRLPGHLLLSSRRGGACCRVGWPNGPASTLVGRPECCPTGFLGGAGL